ncbi:hypothetical protein GCK32_003355 [Trichostrongylus colubriformis]|uniref:Uncharacterized protein n=1 Tax=Trichostrongylus colubriformis TaxID=6319 RepID=A0AAN8FG11_TRICO
MPVSQFLKLQIVHSDAHNIAIAVMKKIDVKSKKTSISSWPASNKRRSRYERVWFYFSNALRTKRCRRHVEECSGDIRAGIDHTAPHESLLRRII